MLDFFAAGALEPRLCVVHAFAHCKKLSPFTALAEFASLCALLDNEAVARECRIRGAQEFNALITLVRDVYRYCELIWALASGTEGSLQAFGRRLPLGLAESLAHDGRAHRGLLHHPAVWDSPLRDIPAQRAPALDVFLPVVELCG